MYHLALYRWLHIAISVAFSDAPASDITIYLTEIKHQKRAGMRKRGPHIWQLSVIPSDLRLQRQNSQILTVRTFQEAEPPKKNSSEPTRFNVSFSGGFLNLLIFS